MAALAAAGSLMNLSRFPPLVLSTLRRVQGSDFEVVRMAGLTVGREGD